MSQAMTDPDGLMVPDFMQEFDRDAVLTPDLGHDTSLNGMIDATTGMLGESRGDYDAFQKKEKAKKRHHRHHKKKKAPDNSLDEMIRATTAKFGEDRAAYDAFQHYSE